jgi:spore coat protein CotF
MKIANKKVEVSQNKNLNDKDYMNRLLTTLKELEKNYVVMLTEASNEYLYNRLYNQFKGISKMQRDVYETMFKYGWYELETADTTKINTKLGTLCNEFTNLTKEK